MNSRTLIQLTFVLLLGIGLVIGRGLWQEYRQEQPNAYLQTIQAFDKAAIQQILIGQGEEQLSLTKEDQTWKVGTKSADLNKINDLLTGLLPDASPLLLSESKESQTTLAIGTDQTVTITLTGQESQTLPIRFGKLTRDGRAVSLGDQPETYLLKEVPFIDLDMDVWYDLTVIDIDSPKITQLAFTTPRKADTFVVEQTKENEWKFVDSQDSVNHDAVNTFTYHLNPLLAQELAFEAKLKQFNQQVTPALSLTVTTATQEATTLAFYKGKTDYLVKRSPNEEFFVLSNSGFADLETKRNEFLAVENKK